MKLDILAFGAHPDDVELGCGGTIAKMVDLGKKVGVIDLTKGELGTRGNVDLRKKEAQKAAEILNLSLRENLGFRDGFFLNDEKNKLKIINKIRQYQPDIVFCNAKEDRHIDHGRAGVLVAESCFLSGLKKIETFDTENKSQKAWRPKYVFHYMQWNEMPPTFVVALNEKYLNTKIKAVKAFESQFYTPDSQEDSTPISSKNFLESTNYRGKNLGRLIGKEAGEGFIYYETLGIDNFDIFVK